MSFKHSQSFSSKINDAQKTPWDYSFLRLAREINARNKSEPEIGYSKTPSDDRVRFGQQPSVQFNPREIAKIGFKNDIPNIKLFSLGLWGAHGPLPLHFTEMAMHRQEMLRDTTIVNFVDMFHHRSMSLFYKAWSLNQSVTSLDRPGDERFTKYISRLMGVETQEISSTTLPVHAHISAAPNLIVQSKSPSVIAQTLNHYFGVPVTIDEYLFSWIEIEANDCTRLSYPGESGMSAVLGQGAVLGEFIPDCQHGFLLTLGPLSLEQYLRFIPNGQDLKTLVDWVRAFIGIEYMWRLKLIINGDEPEDAVLGGAPKLGWSTWLGRNENQQSQIIVGMEFEPEKYI